ncbi:creatininase family protein [Mesorhizobium huakuii]|uniref:Creatininase family protein n=1 Tax=Mesorhizobium huakuii TaxID=28104 RepID=A0A7G6T5L8_9HYPH|nr:creatininase family protein [Mesorhizobium huakuii]QND62050.1 creatininase family protein [Mesorhizobium huakuii]QND69443.1 creatininase family protein [Mesorhizobium loti]
MIFKEQVRWEFLKPQEFLERQKQKPVVYLPMGLCEPHGHVAPFGLDTIKADWLCDEAADRFGGVGAPTMAYHTHETGYHAPWLKEVMGGVNPRLAALPPHLLLETLLYQLRAFRNAGFQAVVVVSGHHGSQDDLRMIAEAFAGAFPIQHFVRTDPELVSGKFTGDHAGRYELSQLLAIRPDLVALDRADRIGMDPLDVSRRILTPLKHRL